MTMEKEKEIRNVATEVRFSAEEGIVEGYAMLFDSSSFGFTVDEDKWEKRDDGIWSRRIIRIAELFDVSPVYRAAYSATSVSLRGRERAEAELREREQRAVAEYIDRIEQSLNI